MFWRFMRKKNYEFIIECHVIFFLENNHGIHLSFLIKKNYYFHEILEHTGHTVFATHTQNQDKTNNNSHQ